MRQTHSDEEPPLRSELFSADQMEQHGRRLATAHQLDPRRAADRLLARLADNETVLDEACEFLTAVVKANRRITPAAEWLLDNFYLIEEQIRTARRHLPRGYSRDLPRLSNGPSNGLPRVYDIALEAISHGDGRVDSESLGRFVAAYQTVTALELGELWAIPIMLRLALIENLRRVAIRMTAAGRFRSRAESWADQMTEAASTDPKSLILVIADMARSDPPMVGPFVAELARRLQGQGPALALPLTWIEQRLSESGQTIEQLVQAENQQQATDQVSISNSIGSLRFLGAMDWREFVEAASVVDQVLREDPVGVYGRMDFATRDRYRHALERIAKRSRLSEADVARSAIDLARSGGDDRRAHVGYYLVGRGLRQLEDAARVHLSGWGELRRRCATFALPLYLGAIVLLTALLTGVLLMLAEADGARGPLLALVGFLSVLGMSQLAVALVNWLATLSTMPQALPRMDLSAGIPSGQRTLVVVPAMLTNPRDIEALIENLEVRFLANRDDHLHFGLLTDFSDADQEATPADTPLLALARHGIEALNRKYGPASAVTGGDIFFLFHRPRRWNPEERLWMGYERKRGKLAQLNSLLRDGSTECFSLIVGVPTVLARVKYVITLDTDTQLPRDVARQLVGAMAHPLNRARYDERLGRVVEGYGIIQPGMAVSLRSANASRYARLCGGEPGVDPYTRAISDVYQDLFGEGSYIGKGIYDVDAFRQALGDRLPENRILSHDLLEGCYARSGLMSDVQLYEDYPSRYSADVARRRRWVRGDWQIATWLLPHVPGPGGLRPRNPLSALSRWKIFDNLRRSLVPEALIALLLLSWALSVRSWVWTLAVLGIVFVPPLLTSGVEAWAKPREALLLPHLASTAHAAGRRLARAAFVLACLPNEAWFSLHALVRANWRVLVSHRKRLEWTPSSELGNGDAGLRASFRSMWAAPVLALIALFGVARANPAALAVALPILCLWFSAPIVAWWVSRPIVSRDIALAPAQIEFLRVLARRTWAYFETVGGVEDHFLPPDNFQEQPAETTAHRTSPTNMGLALLANLAAYDFGYLSAGEVIERSANTLRTMATLERHASHFYNWYDTRSLAPLSAYVSTVDSGNLSAHLWTLRRGLLALVDDPIWAPQCIDGLRDTLEIVAGITGASSADDDGDIAELRAMLRSLRETPPESLRSAHDCLVRLGVAFERLARKRAETPGGGTRGTAGAWAGRLARQCAAAREDLSFLAPWIVNGESPDPGTEDFGAAAIPTLRELAAGSTALPVANPVSARRAQERIDAITRLAAQASTFADIDYGFLYDTARHLLSIGYNVGERRRDASYYDLLASEARLGSFVAIAQGRLPQEHWFALGRTLIGAGGAPVLLSWSGSMFEYLMPLLVMPRFSNTLLDETYLAAVQRQIEYGKRRGVPWGISESGYNTIDAGLNYQYRAFGVPGLGLKRGLAADLVVAPYASALALMVVPQEACRNLQRLAAAGFDGEFGLYEAIDYTPSRVPRGQRHAVVRSFMAHHQGMTLLALDNAVADGAMQRRFAADPLFQATMLLLHERIPKPTGYFTHAAELTDLRMAIGGFESQVRVIGNPNTPVPEVQLLSNGRLHVMVTSAGGGYSRWKDFRVTRWREDTTCDGWGAFCYIRDTVSGVFWSAAHQPTRARPAHYEAILSEARAEFRRRDDAIETHTEITVSPEDDIELRRIRLVNHGRARRNLEVTSYAEVVLAVAGDDDQAPAFSNLFVQTELLMERNAILCTRRPRSTGEQVPWMFHLMTAHGDAIEAGSCETDRMQFVGRGHTTAAPRALRDPGALSGSTGSVLDPIVAIRRCVTLAAGESAILDIVTGVSETREGCLRLIDKYQDPHLADRVFDLAWTHSRVVLGQLNATESDAQLYGRLAGSVLYANASLRADHGTLRGNRRGQSGLWGYAISGDLPIVLLQVADVANIELVRQMVQAHAYWRIKGLAVDLVIWNEDHSSYRQALHDSIMGLITAGVEAHALDRPGGIFVRRTEQIAEEDRILLQSVARVIITDSKGTLADQINRRTPPTIVAPRVGQAPIGKIETEVDGALPDRALLFDNGIGGFTPDGREYVITLGPGQTTPAPWVNVLANAQFGTVISESGQAYTWSENAHEFRLTPWHNDPVSDTAGEAWYLRDEETGEYWSPTPLPRRGATSYVTRHGFGYSVFEHVERGIHSELWVYVAIDAAVKFAVLKTRNASGRTRRLSATGYVQWVLGDLPAKTGMHVMTEVDRRTGALLARNPYNTEFAGRIAFFDVDDPQRSVTGDRSEFVGRNGELGNPAAMDGSPLSGRVGPALDPCGVIRVPFELADGQEREIVFRLGAGRTADEVNALVLRSRGSAAARTALENVWSYWARTLGAVQVVTPDPALDVLTNGWLVYQVLASRLWARSGYYQSAGAFGFRDQLQDVMALVHAEPRVAREHLVRCAGRQFREGDVQHWWHPPSGRGVRTHCSDDYLWLALATCRYVLATGDTTVLDESVHFLEGRALGPEEDSYYDLPGRSEEAASLYEHCVRAILRALRFGAHGLPLMGTGDWNDGMNLVGVGGKGESVWLAFLLHDVLNQFAELAELRGDHAFVERCNNEAAGLRKNIETNGWDGKWYRRAYFDDGSPLGSVSNPECRIDSIAQSWSVLSGAGSGEHPRLAMDAVDSRLVRRDVGLIQLLDPPFDRSSLNPGYIKGYVPGVRENGGQYTHAAVWAAMAFAALGDRARSSELLSMLNPVNHSRTPASIATYKTEPYVVAADVYALSPHTGRGGWTWYTGSAGWMYRMILESLLGLRRHGDRLHFAPGLPLDWPRVDVTYRFRESIYRIAIVQASDADIETVVMVDGVAQLDRAVSLVDDRVEHNVEIIVSGGVCMVASARMLPDDLPVRTTR
ncbi:MAG TPA: glucoamylase family protein [Casimicrobiaceae bacterium]